MISWHILLIMYLGVGFLVGISCTSHAAIAFYRTNLEIPDNERFLFGFIVFIIVMSMVVLWPVCLFKLQD